MTAVNALCVPEAAFLLCDTAVYDRECVVVGFAPKAFTVPHLRMAFATSGSHEQGPRVLSALMEFGSFDELVDGGSAHLRDLWESGEFECTGYDRDDFRLIMVGWSDRNAHAELWVTSTAKEPDVAPFEFAKAQVAINPGTDFDVLRDAGLLSGDTPVGGDPEQWLGKLIDIQRSRACGPRGQPAPYAPVADGDFVVGGAAVLTKVTKHGIVQRVVRRWHDRIGELINPNGETMK
jgi:hypothetical protein